MSFLSKKAEKLTPYTSGIRPLEEGWIKLNTNENPYPPSPKVIEALRNAPFEKLRLYPDSDSGELRKALADHLGVGVNDVFCGNGSDEVLALTFQAFFSGKGVLVPDVSYGFYPVWSEMYDVDVKSVPLNADFTINVSDYKGSSGVLIANPNAPTGLALTLDEIEEVVRNNPGGVVAVDEAYIDFARVGSAVGLINKYENLLVIKTFSKSYSLAGQRAGFAAGNENLISGLQRMKNAFNSYPLDSLTQIGAAAAIRDTDHWNETRNKIIATRDKTAKALRASGFNVLESHANFLFMQCENAKDLYEYLLGNKILVRYWDKPRINNHLRISIGTDEEMAAMIQCVQQFSREPQTKHQ